MRHLRPSNLKVSFSGHLVIIIIVASGLIACSAPVVLSALSTELVSHAIC